MQDDFQILAGFLERCGDEVEGRSIEEPPENVLAQLAKLARGILPDGEMPQLMQKLHHNPQWIPRLAQEVRALRGDSAAGA